MKTTLRILALGSAMALAMTASSIAQSGSSANTYNPSSGAVVGNNDNAGTATNRFDG